MYQMREKWTDERLDDLKDHVDDGFRRMDEGFARIDSRLDKTHHLLVQYAIGMIAAMAALYAAMLGLIFTQL